MDFREDRMLGLEDKVEKMDIHMTEHSRSIGREAKAKSL